MVLNGLMAVKLARPVGDSSAELPDKPVSPWTFQENGARNDSDSELMPDQRAVSRLARLSLGKVNSLHGAKAARRHAITELLFFSSVGDVVRCQRICSAWKIDVRPLLCHYQTSG